MFCKTSPEKKIHKNYKVFKKKKTKALRAKTPEKQIKYIEKAAQWAAYNTCGTYACPEFEKILCHIAQQYPTPDGTEPKPHSRLHVMTTAYKTGGHTRVVEQWIANKPEEQHHDLVILDQAPGHLPQYLKNTLKAQESELFLFKPEGSKIEEALKLRALACRYEKIILHTHMEDATATLAFGTEAFKRPIITFDHAEHMFWLGASISDISAVLSPDTIPFSIERRGVEAHYVPLPIEIRQLPTKEEARTRLGIPQNKRIMLSIGGDYRFRPSNEMNFAKLCCDVIKEVHNGMAVIIGPTPGHHFWKDAYKNLAPEQFKLTGLIADKQHYYDYIAATDVYVESLPIGGDTTSLEVAVSNKPTLVLDKPMRRSSAWRGHPEPTVEALTKKTIGLLNKTKEFDTSLIEKIRKMHSKDGFQAYLKQAEAKTPDVHQLHSIPEEKVRISDYDRFMIQHISTKTDPLSKKIYRKTIKKLFKRLGIIKTIR